MKKNNSSNKNEPIIRVLHNSNSDNETGPAKPKWVPTAGPHIDNEPLTGEWYTKYYINKKMDAVRELSLTYLRGLQLDLTRVRQRAFKHKSPNTTESDLSAIQDQITLIQSWLYNDEFFYPGQQKEKG